MYHVFLWMRGHRILGQEYKPHYTHFCQSLLNSKNEFYTPPVSNYEFLDCCIMARYGPSADPSIRETLIEFIQTDTHYDVDFHKIATYLAIQVSEHRIVSIHGGSEIRKVKVYNPEGVWRVALLTAGGQTHSKGWAWIIPKHSGIIPIQRKRCNICLKWRKSVGFTTHTATCMRCQCGTCHKQGDEHETTCKKRAFNVHSNDKEQKEKLKIYKTSKAKKANMSSCYFSDFECFVPPDSSKFQPYSCGITGWKEKKSDKVHIFSGEDCMDNYIQYLRELKGTLWFFYGGRFDTYFLLESCLRLGLAIKSDSILKKGSQILCFTIITSKGELDVKDFYRFVPGSLDSNCISFGIDKKYCKTGFEHGKIKDWNDVITHKEEFEEYLRLDCLALREIYFAYANQVWEDHNLHVCQYMTASHLFLAAWTTTLSNPGEIYRTEKVDEENIRASYRGGRIIGGRASWNSSYLNQILETNQDGFISQELYDQIDDDLFYLDVNSLYPYAQVMVQYPAGKPLHIQFKEETPSVHQKRLLRNLHAQKKANKSYWNRIIACVDVTCPTDISVGFLMNRDKNSGETTQDLFDKKKEWYTGPELWESIKIGYKITRIYEYYIWPHLSDLFSAFVKPAYEAKAKTPKDTPKYMIIKTKVNALTGKFGQKQCVEKIHIVRDMNELKNISYFNLDTITDSDTGEVLGFCAEERTDYTYTSYPIHLSCFILGHSRVIMSRIMRNMGSYYNKKLCPYYGDTDSFIVCTEAKNNCPKKRFGKELGQLKSEVEGKIVGIIVIAPKSYNIVYVCERTKKIMTRTRCKGIPHPGEDYEALNEYPSPHHMEIMNMKTDIEKKKFFVSSDIRMTGYIIEEENNIQVSTHIPSRIFPKLLSQEARVTCLYGSMKRQLDLSDMSRISIFPTHLSRELGKTNWWKTGKRLLEDPSNLCSITHPPGHQFFIQELIDLL